MFSRVIFRKVFCHKTFLFLVHQLNINSKNHVVIKKLKRKKRFWELQKDLMDTYSQTYNFWDSGTFRHGHFVPRLFVPEILSPTKFVTMYSFLQKQISQAFCRKNLVAVTFCLEKYFYWYLNLVLKILLNLLFVQIQKINLQPN